jgi:hypothetical protein
MLGPASYDHGDGEDAQRAFCSSRDHEKCLNFDTNRNGRSKCMPQDSFCLCSTNKFRYEILISVFRYAQWILTQRKHTPVNHRPPNSAAIFSFVLFHILPSSITQVVSLINTVQFKLLLLFIINKKFWEDLIPPTLPTYISHLFEVPEPNLMETNLRELLTSFNSIQFNLIWPTYCSKQLGCHGYQTHSLARLA